MVDTNFHIDIQVTNLPQLTALSNAMLNLNASTMGVIKQVKNFDPVTKGLNAALGRSDRGVNNHAKSLGQLISNQSALGAESKRVKADIKAYSGALLSNTVEARRNLPILRDYSKSLTSIKSRALIEDLKSMSVEMRRLGKDAQFTGRSMIIGITTPILAFAKTGLFAFEKLDAELVRLNKLVDNVASSIENAYVKMGISSATATEQQKQHAQQMVNEFNKVDQSLLQVSRNFGVARELIVSIAGDFAELGLNTNESMVALTQLSAEAEKLGNLDIGPAKDLVQSMYAQASTIIQENAIARGKLVNAINVEKEAVNVAAGQLAMFNSIENTTALSLRDLAQAFPEVAASATAFGLSMTESAALLAPMKAAGFDVGASANSIKVSLQRLNDPTVKSTKLMELLSKTTGYDFSQATHLGLTSIDALAKGYATLTQATNYGKEGALEFFSQLFGVRQGPRMEKAIQDLSLFNSMLKQTGSVESTLAGTANSVLNLQNTLLPTIKSFSDIGVIARASAADVGDQIKYLDELGKEQVLTVTNREIEAAKKARAAVGKYILDQESKGRNLLSEITSQSGRALVVELGGVAAASERSKSELNTALGSVRVTMDKIKTDFKFFAAEFVKSFKPTLEAIGRFVSRLVTKFQSMSPASKKMIAAFAAIAAAAGPLVFAFGQAGLFLSTLANGVLKFLPGLSHLTVETVASTQSLLRLRKPLVMIGDTIETGTSRFGLMIARMANMEGPVGKLANKFGILTGHLRSTKTASDDVLSSVAAYRRLPRGTDVNDLRSLAQPSSNWTPPASRQIPPGWTPPNTPTPTPVTPTTPAGWNAIQQSANTAATTTTTAATTAATTTTTAATTSASATTGAATTSASTTTGAATTSAATVTGASTSAATTTTGAAAASATTTTTGAGAAAATLNTAATTSAATTDAAATSAAATTDTAASVAAGEIASGAAEFNLLVSSTAAEVAASITAAAAASEALSASTIGSLSTTASALSAQVTALASNIIEEMNAGTLIITQEAAATLTEMLTQVEAMITNSTLEMNGIFDTYVAAVQSSTAEVASVLTTVQAAALEEFVALESAATSLGAASAALMEAAVTLGTVIAPLATLPAEMLALNAGAPALKALPAAGMTQSANTWGYMRQGLRIGVNKPIIETTLANPNIMGALPAAGQTVKASSHLPIRGARGRMQKAIQTTLAGPEGGYFPLRGEEAARVAAEVEAAMATPQLALTEKAGQARRHAAIPRKTLYPNAEFANALEANQLTPAITTAIPMAPVPTAAVAQEFEQAVSTAYPMGMGPIAMGGAGTAAQMEAKVAAAKVPRKLKKAQSGGAAAQKAARKAARSGPAAAAAAASTATTEAAMVAETAVADASAVATTAAAQTAAQVRAAEQSAAAAATREMRAGRRALGVALEKESIAAKNAAETAAVSSKRSLFRAFKPKRGSYTDQLFAAAQSDIPGAPMQGAASFAENAVAYETRKAGRMPRRALRKLLRGSPLSNAVPMSAKGAIENALPYEEEIGQRFLQTKYTGARLTDKVLRLPGSAKRAAARTAARAGEVASTVAAGVGSAATKGAELGAVAIGTGASALRAGAEEAGQALNVLKNTAETTLEKSGSAFTKFSSLAYLRLGNVKDSIKSLASKGFSGISKAGSNLATSFNNSRIGGFAVRSTTKVAKTAIGIAKSPYTVLKGGIQGAQAGMQPMLGPAGINTGWTKARGAVGGFATGITDVIKKVFSLKKLFLGLGITAIIFAIIAGIKILVDAFKSGGSAMKNVGKTLSQAWDLIKSAIMAIVAPIKDTITTLVSMVGGKQKKGLAGGFSNAADTIKKMAQAISDFIKKYIVPIVSFLMTQVVAIVKSIVKFIQGFIEIIKGHWKKGFKLLAEAALGMARVVIKIIVWLLKGWITIWEKTVKGIVSLITGLAGSIVKGIGWAIEKAAGFIADMVESIPGIGGLLAGPIREAGQSISDGADALAKGAKFLGDKLNQGVGYIADGVKSGIDAVGGYANGLIDKAIGKQDELVKGVNNKKNKDDAYEKGKETGEAYADGMGNGLEEYQNKINDAIKTALENMQQKFADLVLGKMSDALSKATEGMTDALQKQKDAALKVYDDQLSNLDKMQKAEESLTKEMQYQSDRRRIIKERELQVENYQRNRALAIYEGRIDDARMLSLEEVKNSQDYNDNLKNLDESRQRDLASENLQALRDAISAAQGEASKFFDDQIKNFQDAAKEITKFPPQTIQEYKAQLDKLNKLASDAAKNNGDSFSGMLEGMVSNINETIPNKGVPAFSNALDQLTQVANEKYGMGTDGIAGMTVAMLENIGATIGSDTLINANFTTIVDNLKNSASGAFDEIANTIVTPALGTISTIVTENDPFKVLAESVAFANETIMREMTGMVNSVSSHITWLLPYISNAVNQLTMLNAAAAAAENLPQPELPAPPIAPPSSVPHPVGATGWQQYRPSPQNYFNAVVDNVSKNMPVPYEPIAKPTPSPQNYFNEVVDNVSQNMPAPYAPIAKPTTSTAPPATTKPNQPRIMGPSGTPTVNLLKPEPAGTKPKGASAPHMDKPFTPSTPINPPKPGVTPAKPNAPKSPARAPHMKERKGFEYGGIVKAQAYALGGLVKSRNNKKNNFEVPGFGSTAVPALLHGGEFVVNSKAVKNIGMATLSLMNNLRFKKGKDIGNIDSKNPININNNISGEKPIIENPLKSIEMLPVEIMSITPEACKAMQSMYMYKGEDNKPDKSDLENRKINIPKPENIKVNIPNIDVIKADIPNIQDIKIKNPILLDSMKFRSPENTKTPANIVNSTNNNSTINIYVDNFIGEDEWFKQMIKQYNMNVLPRNQKGAGLENRTIQSYNGLSRGM